MDLINITIAFTFVINLFLALTIYLHSHNNKANLVFVITSVSISAWCLAMIFYRTETLEISLFWVRMLYLFATIIPSSFYIFSLYFLKKTYSKKTIKLVVVLNIIVALLTLYPNAVVVAVKVNSNAENSIVFGWAYYLFYITYIISLFTASFVVLFRKYIQSSALGKTQITYILFGSIVTSIIGMVTNLILPTLGIFTFNWVGQTSTVLWVSFVAYAIIKHRLMDVRLVIARTITYILLIISLALFYAVGLFVLGNLLISKSSTVQELILSTSLALFMAFTFQPLRHFFEKFTNNIFYKDHYDSQILLKTLGKIMASSISLEQLAGHILEELLLQMRVNQGAFILTTNGQITSVIHKGYNVAPHFDFDNLKEFINHTETLIFEELPEGELKEKMRTLDCKIIIRLHNHENEIGFLVLGQKLSGDIYTPEDIKVLEILAPEAAVGIQNALGYKQIKEFNSTLQTEVNKATEEMKNINEDIYKKNMALHKVTEELAEANEKLKQLDKLKDEFVSLASHELRTPMTAIKSYLWLFMQNKNVHLEDKDKQYIERAYASTDRLIALVNDMLNVSRIEAGRLDVTLVSLNPVNLARDVVEELKPAAEKLHVTLALSTESDHLPNVMADQNKLKEVLINLIGNALKFTSENGTITIKLFQDRDMIVTQVIDNGKGIKKEDQQKLFQKFTMLNNNHLLRNGAQGTGLGLYITKSIIGLHGGTIWVESEGENKGTTFSFTLKIDTSQQVVAPKTTSSENHEPTAAMMTA